MRAESTTRQPVGAPWRSHAFPHSGLLDRVDRCLFATSLVFILLYIAEICFLLPQQYIKNYNEGWNAYQSLRAISGPSLYTNLNSYTSNDYAPLYFYITGYIGIFTGDNVITGRVLALIGLLTVGLGIALITRKLCASLRMGVFAGLLFLANALAWYPQYVAMGDPQWVGQAFMVMAVAVMFIGEEKPSAIVLAALLMVIGGFVKQTLFPVPIATGLWIVTYRRKNVPVFVLSSLLFLGIGFGTFYLTNGQPFLDAIFQRVDRYTYSYVGVIHRLFVYAAPMLPLFVASVILFVRYWRDGEVKFLLIYFVVAGIWMVISSGIAGFNYNQYFDMLIASCISAVLLLGKLQGAELFAGRSTREWRTVLMLLLMVPPMLALPREMEGARRVARLGGDTREDVRLIAASAGPAMCELSALCYWAGKNFEMDFFNTGQKMRRDHS